MIYVLYVIFVLFLQISNKATTQQALYN